MSEHAQSAGHPAPHRHKASIPAQLAGLAIGPAVWAIQLEVGYSLTSYACQPAGDALSAFAPGWTWARGASLTLNLAALAACVVAGLVALRFWRSVGEETTESGRHLMEVGEGRTRFLTLWGALTSLGFAVATAFDTVMLLGAPACRA